MMPEPGDRRGPLERQPLRPEQQLFGEVANLAELTGSWAEAISSRDLPALAEFSGQAQMQEAMLRQKGPDGNWLQLIVESVKVLRDGLRSPAFDALPLQQQLTELVRNGGLAPVGLVEWSAALYHLRQDRPAAGLALAISELDDSVAPALVRTMALNNLGAAYDRAGRVDDAREANRRGLQLLEAAAATEAGRGPNADWERLKLQHGLVVQRARGKVFPDMPQQLLEIAAQRQQLGDTAHIGRTYLDVGRLFGTLGETEAAQQYLTMAVETMMEHGYNTAAASGAQELARVRRRTGEPARAQRWLRTGLALAEPTKAIWPEKVAEMQLELNEAIALPARCLTKLPDGRYLVEVVPTSDQTRYAVLTVDQEKKKGGEGYVRRNLATLLTHLLSQAEVATAKREPIQLSQKQTGVHFREKWPDAGTIAYAVELPAGPGILALQQALDAGPVDGYGAMSIAELTQQRELFDLQSQRLIDLEIARQTPESKYPQ